jgi:predicted  nucleic acid-binding Zn-ribbon protein
MSLAELTPEQTAMRDALFASLADAVNAYEERAEAVQETQQLFSNQLDMLQRELDSLAEFSALPSLEKYIKLLSDAKRRLVAVNSSIAVIAERLRRTSAVIAAKRHHHPAGAAAVSP